MVNAENVRTIGELRKALDVLEAQGVINGDTPIAIRGSKGGTWENGFNALEVSKLLRYGTQRDGFITVEETNKSLMGSYDGPCKEFTALKFD